MLVAVGPGRLTRASRDPRAWTPGLVEGGWEDETLISQSSGGRWGHHGCSLWGSAGWAALQTLPSCLSPQLGSPSTALVASPGLLYPLLHRDLLSAAGVRDRANPLIKTGKLALCFS